QLVLSLAAIEMRSIGFDRTLGRAGLNTRLGTLHRGHLVDQCLSPCALTAPVRAEFESTSGRESPRPTEAAAPRPCCAAFRARGSAVPREKDHARRPHWRWFRTPRRPG